MNFTKMHGAGNDYIYVNCFREKVKNPEKVAWEISRRRFSVGADGLVLIKPSFCADCFMDIYNSDGSRAKMCGNAVRCVAKYLFDNGIVSSDTAKIETLSGIKTVERTGDFYRVNMGKPILNGHSIPTRFGSSIVKNERIYVNDETYSVTCLSMGNPHCAVFCRDVDSLNLERLGPGFEYHEMFPERINTEFIETVSDTELTMRVWERGSGETLACGTGASAAAVASVINGRARKNSEIKINLPGGVLYACWADSDEVFLSGPAVTVYSGEIETE